MLVSYLGFSGNYYKKNFYYTMLRIPITIGMK